MGMPGWAYRYVGPVDLKALVRPGGEGARMCSPAGFEAWASAQAAVDPAEPFTYVVDRRGFLRLAPRRSEHVVCAGGEAVLAAGEIGFRDAGGRWVVGTVSNQSTGYCPDADSWPAVAAALERIGITPPPGFTHVIVFRRCPACRQVGIVHDEDFACVFCDAPLPREWNVGGADRQGSPRSRPTPSC